MTRNIGAPVNVRKAFGPRFPTRVLLALYHAAKRFPGGGITKVAELVEMDSDVLQKKLSPTCETHNLWLDEAERLMYAMRDPAPAIEFARAAGLACIPMPCVEDGQLQRSLADVAKEFADLVAASADAMRDGRMSQNEYAQIERQGAELIIAYTRHLACARAALEEARA